jgi:hypothetical protein
MVGVMVVAYFVARAARLGGRVEVEVAAAS